MIEYKKLYDISVAISNDTVVYPGDPKVEISEFKPLTEKSSRLSNVFMGTHSGTHIDSPAHCIQGGKGISDLSLESFVGECRVLDFSELTDKISIEDLKQKGVMKGERILAKTRNSKEGFLNWRDNFVYLDGDAADYLAEVGITLFGIDYLSVKQKGSKDNRAHNSLLKKDIPILETIDLSKVEEGYYFLMCAPLKLVGVEGAPARAILLQI